MKKAVVYIRMSTESQEDSPERQRSTTMRAVKQENFDFAEEYFDGARKGWDDTRTDFQRLLTDAKAKKFDVIVVDECSRLSRNEPLSFLATVAYPLSEAGVRLYSVSEGGFQDWNTLTGVLLSAVHQDRSSTESKKIGYRVATEYLKRAKQGRMQLGKPPFGYQRVWLDTTGKVVHEGMYPPEHVQRMQAVPKLVPGNPADVQVVKDVFDWYVHQDKSLRDIGRELEGRGIQTPSGKGLWSQNCVGRILREVKYTGTYVFNRVGQGQFYRLGSDSVHQTPAGGSSCGLNPKEAWTVIRASHEAIISEELFERTQKLLTANRTRTTPTPNRGNFLLTKLLACAACGSPMSGHRNKPGGPAFYRCQKAMDSAQRHCHNNLVKEEEVLDGIMLALEEQLVDPRFIDLCVAEARRWDEEETDVDRVKILQTELKKLDRDIDRAHGRLSLVDDEAFDAINDQLAVWKNRKKEVETELGQVGISTHKRSTEELFEWVEAEVLKLRSAIRDKKWEHLRATIRRLVSSVRVRVDRRLVGKVKYGYTLVGGDVVIAGEQGRLGQSTGVYLSSSTYKEVDPTAYLSPSRPRACPR